MTIASSGSVSMSTVNTELGLTSTASITLNDTLVRRLAQKASGAITLDDCRGKKYLDITSGYVSSGSPFNFYLRGYGTGLTALALDVGSYNTNTSLLLSGYTIRGVTLYVGSGVYTVNIDFDGLDVPDIWETVTLTSSTGSKTYTRTDFTKSNVTINSDNRTGWSLTTTSTEVSYWSTHFGSNKQVDIVFTLP